MINEKERKFLKTLAHDSIQHTLKTSKEMPYGIVEALAEDSISNKNLGCFVTLKLDQNLRGCIGSITSDIPLYQNVIANAYNAAFRDPRFLSLTEEEFSSIEIEISIMGEVTPLKSIDDIVIGRDGLIIKSGRFQGLLLPQVALEWNFSKEQFIEHTCIKAGLDKDAYKLETTEIFYFKAFVF